MTYFLVLYFKFQNYQGLEDCYSILLNSEYACKGEQNLGFLVMHLLLRNIVVTCELLQTTYKDLDFFKEDFEILMFVDGQSKEVKSQLGVVES